MSRSAMLRAFAFSLAGWMTLSLSACSTFNPFKSDAPVDYNALTYGDQYRDSRPNARTDVRMPEARASDDWTTGDASSNAWSDRAPANVPDSGQATASQSYYGNNDPALDPTDESVRQRIEMDRGLAVDHYRLGDRATREDFYDRSSGDGSLWSNENDANYFFTKGKVRANGDVISIKMEEPLIRQIADEIKKNLSPAEQEVEMALYRKNNALAKNDKDLSAYRNLDSDDLHSSEAEAVKERMEKSVRWSQVDLSSALGVSPKEELRAEIIDRYQNGNYKIRAVKRVLYRGSSKLMSLVAIAPASDFNDKDMIDSGKLYEYQIKIAR